MVLSETEYKKIEHDAIQLFIERLRENDITCGIRVFDEMDYYTIFLDDKESSERDIINEIFYDIDTQFNENLYKNIDCEYLYCWFENEKEIQETLKIDGTKDITECFNNTQNRVSVIENSEISMVSKLFLSFFEDFITSFLSEDFKTSSFVENFELPTVPEVFMPMSALKNSIPLSVLPPDDLSSANVISSDLDNSTAKSIGENNEYSHAA